MGTGDHFSPTGVGPRRHLLDQENKPKPKATKGESGSLGSWETFNFLHSLTDSKVVEIVLNVN